MPQTASRCQSTRAGRKISSLANPWLTPSALRNGGSSNSVNRKAWGSSLSKRWPCSGTPTNTQNWDYDAVGNWDSITTNSTTQTRGANRQNEITSVSSATTPTYDNNGNLTKDENGYRFVWDAWNRLVQIKNSSNTVIATNAFDGLNRKAQVTTSSGTIDRIFSSDWQVLEEKSGSNIKNRYVWSPAYVDALVLRDRDTDANGTLDERLYPLQDANWNTTTLVNTSGSVVERDTYSPFGVVTFRDASGASIGASAKDWLFLHQGGQTDSIGNYDFRNRIYSPTLGRWLTNDPLGFAAGDGNFYRYVGNGPGNGLDPKGLQGPQKQLDETNKAIIITPIITELALGKYGKFIREATFNRIPGKDGYIVQHVIIKTIIRDGRIQFVKNGYEGFSITNENIHFKKNGYERFIITDGKMIGIDRWSHPP